MFRASSLGRRVTEGLARRLARWLPSYFAKRARNPIFVVGFNNSGKSSIVGALGVSPDLCVFPGEGNGELWFPGFFPWMESSASVDPIWHDPDRFVEAALQSRTDDFRGARAALGAYQWLSGGDSILNDSGMLAALTPELARAFPDARFIHVVRDGSIASYLAARNEWSRMMRSPVRYLDQGISMRFDDVLEHMARYWAWTIARVRSIRAELGREVLEVRFEDLCANPLDVMRDVGRLGGSTRAPRGPAGFHNLNRAVADEISEEHRALIRRAIADELGGMGYAHEWDDPIGEGSGHRSGRADWLDTTVPEEVGDVRDLA